MRNGPSIRGLRESDLHAITAIYAHHVRHGLASFEIEPPDEAEMERRWRDVIRRGLPYIAAVTGGVLAGYAYAAPYRRRAAYLYTVEDSIYVHPEHTGRGVGLALLSALIQSCERGGCRQMVAVIGDSANRPSIALHERCGFQRVGLLPGVGFKFGRWVDSVLMQRPLGDGSGALPRDIAPGARPKNQ